MRVGAEAGVEGIALAALTWYKEWTKEVIALASKARKDGRNAAFI